MANRHGRRGGRTTPKGTRPGESRSPESSVASQSDVLLRDAERASRDIYDVNEAEGWASAIQTVFHPSGIPPRPTASPKIILRAAKAHGGTAGAMLAAAMAVYGPKSTREQAAQLRDTLISSNLQMPSWVLDLGRVEPSRVVMLSDVWGDGCSIHLDCVRDGQTIGIGTTIDSIAGVVAHGFSYGPNTAKVEEFALDDPNSFITEIDPADARATVEAALARADQSVEVDDDESGSDDPDPDLRALVEHRFSLLPDGGTPLVRPINLGETRVKLTARFLALPGVVDLPDIDDLIDTICDFANYCDGDPLRWSPARIHMFLAVWIPAKVIADEAWYHNLPVVLREWLRFAATERGLPAQALEVNLSVVDGAMDAMQQNRLDPTKASPGSAIMRDMLADQIDITNQAETQAWIDQRNIQDGNDQP